jgi:mono/diheme cytochrome c family protein
MRKKILILLALACFLFVVVGSSLAEQKTGNEKKGKYLYRKNCRACHIDGGSAMVLSPNSKTQEQWERAFEKYERLKCVDEWKKLTEQDLEDILSYLYNHAFDSPTPATCG